MIELGLDTFGDVVLGSDGRPVTQAQALRNVVAEGVLADAARDRCVRRWRAPPRRLRRVRAGSGPGRHRRQDRADPSRVGGDGAELGRSGQGVSAILDAQRVVERARRSDSWQRFVHRVVSAVWLRPVAVQRAVRREAGCSRSPQLSASTAAPSSIRQSRTAACERGSASAEVPNRSCARRGTVFR